MRGGYLQRMTSYGLPASGEVLLMGIVHRRRKSILVFELIDFILSIIGAMSSMVGLIYEIRKDKHKESNPPDQRY